MSNPGPCDRRTPGNMEHLRLAIGFMCFLSVGTFFLTRRIIAKAPNRLLDALAVLVLLMIAAYVWLVWGQLWIVNWIPLPSVIVLSNWYPILLAILAAILWQRQQNLLFARRLPIQAALMGVTIWSIIYVIPRTPPECGNEWIPAEPPIPFRICRQTTPFTCSAASVATILESLGEEATEAEMAKLCLTRQGTTWLGMYHGLSIKLWGTSRHVRFFESTVDELAAVAGIQPILLCCQLTDEVAAANPEYSDQEGWIVGVQHSVVCFAVQGRMFLIGDPSQPKLERWSFKDMANLWTGKGLMVIND